MLQTNAAKTSNKSNTRTACLILGKNHQNAALTAVKPDKIQVQAEQSGPLKAGERARFHCGASGHTSKPLISWWKSELREDRLTALNESVRAQLFAKISDNEVLEFQAMPDDHGKVLKCKVKMPSLDTFELSEHVSIQVLCKCSSFACVHVKPTAVGGFS